MAKLLLNSKSGQIYLSLVYFQSFKDGKGVELPHHKVLLNVLWTALKNTVASVSLWYERLSFKNLLVIYTGLARSK